MDSPIADLMDESACSESLVDLLHPDGLACPHCGDPGHSKVHRRDRAPILASRCTAGSRISTASTKAAPRGTRRRPIELVLIRRGIAQGVSTAQLARQSGSGRPELLASRHRLRELGLEGLDRTPLADAAIEADEMSQDAGGKRRPAPRRGRPAGATGQQGRGPRHPGGGPAAGARGGRAPERSGEAAPRASDGPSDVGGGGRRPEPQGAMASTDEWRGHGHLPEMGRGHASVWHTIGEWARDDDGDGIREVPDDSPEGKWAGLRNRRRILRGVSKEDLHQYVAIFEWSYEVRRATPELLRSLLGVRHRTNGRT